MHNNLSSTTGGSFNISSSGTNGNFILSGTNSGTSTGTSTTLIGGSFGGSTTTYDNFTSTTYKLWDSEVHCYNTDNALVIISMLNMLGTSLWDQMVSNGAENEMDNTLFTGIQGLYKKQKRKENLDILLKDGEEDF